MPWSCLRQNHGTRFLWRLAERCEAGLLEVVVPVAVVADGAAVQVREVAALGALSGPFSAAASMRFPAASCSFVYSVSSGVVDINDLIGPLAHRGDCKAG